MATVNFGNQVKLESWSYSSFNHQTVLQLSFDTKKLAKFLVFWKFRKSPFFNLDRKLVDKQEKVENLLDKPGKSQRCIKLGVE